MKICVFILFMVIHTLTAEKAISKLSRKLVIPKLNDTCRKIKCAAIEEPECVKLKRHDLPMDVHIIVVNKCELEYMKCHEGVEAKIVPMKFCSHGKRIGMAHKKKKTDSKSKVNKRVKRRVFRKEALATEARVKLVNRPKYVDAMNKYHEPTSSTTRKFGVHKHPFPDPWSPKLYSRNIPPELYLYLVM
ncbi:hypothetical protein B5X24_HaOG214533 [Helicoverpa armigera]|uniref:Uncharacterized protein n=1 Tax=Helicoverpa armigera TaxID=29058 RepID=A0A2W1BCA7_HELAM|nr:hypothetical protein B5X24_HaOG214533 [Helicoverpa armigera]